MYGADQKEQTREGFRISSFAGLIAAMDAESVTCVFRITSRGRAEQPEFVTVFANFDYFCTCLLRENSGVPTISLEPSLSYMKVIDTGIATSSIISMTSKDQRRKKNRYNEMSVLTKSINVNVCGNPAMYETMMSRLHQMNQEV
ncbi:hypothetical protein BGX24_006018, partial [Mortierella sp. AD032]